MPAMNKAELLEKAAELGLAVEGLPFTEMRSLVYKTIREREAQSAAETAKSEVVEIVEPLESDTSVVITTMTHGDFIPAGHVHVAAPRVTQDWVPGPAKKLTCPFCDYTFESTGDDRKDRMKLDSHLNAKHKG